MHIAQTKRIYPPFSCTSLFDVSSLLLTLCLNFPGCVLFTSEMVHIKQSDRVMVGLDGKLYFANLLKSDSKEDYICNAQYAEARTILPDTVVALKVMPSEYTHTHGFIKDLTYKTQRNDLTIPQVTD